MEASAARQVSEFVSGMEKRKIHSGSELASLGKSLVTDEAVIGAISEYLFAFLNIQSNGDKEHGLLGRLYAQLYRCLRSNNADLMSFVAQLIIPLIWRHFDDYCGPSGKTEDAEEEGLSTEDVLVACYNVLVLDEKGHCKTVTYVIPDLTVPSVYHDPSEFSTLLLQKTYLEANKEHVQQAQHKDVVLHLSDRKFVGPVDKLTRTGRWIVFRALMRYLALDLIKCTAACQQNVLKFGQVIYGEDPSGNSSDEQIPDENSWTCQSDRRFQILRSLNKYVTLRTGSSLSEKESSPNSTRKLRNILQADFLLGYLDLLSVLIYQEPLRVETVEIAKKILKQGEHMLQPSIVLLASAIVARGEARGGAEDDIEKPVVPPIKCFGGLEHRALLQTTSSLRWKKVVDIPIILKPGEERSYRENEGGRDEEAGVEVARKSGGKANYEEDEELYEENVKIDVGRGIVDPTS